MPSRTKSLQKLQDAEEYFANQWLLGANYINKSYANSTFGRKQANIALSRYFNPVRRGSNLSGKLTEVKPRDIDGLPTDRQQLLLDKALKDVPDTLGPPPDKFDLTSVICIQKERCEEAVNWCISTRRFQFIKQVRILMQHRFWTVHYTEKTDRFYAIWPFCLTNWPGELRRIILSGTDYDIKNAVGEFIFETVGPELNKYKEVKEYLENPKSMRIRLVNELGIDEDQAKKVLHATLNGCGATESMVIKNQSALCQIINQGQALQFVKTYQTLIKQLTKIRKSIAPDRKSFMRAYFAWEKQKTGIFFNGTGLIMHDGIDGCALSTIIPAHFSENVKMSEGRSVWDEESVVDRLIAM